MVCYHAIHNWQLGWAKPMAHLNGSVLTPGVWYGVTLLDGTTNPTNTSVRINTNWAGAAFSTSVTYYVSFRQEGGALSLQRDINDCAMQIPPIKKNFLPRVQNWRAMVRCASPCMARCQHSGVSRRAVGMARPCPWSCFSPLTSACAPAFVLGVG